MTQNSTAGLAFVLGVLGAIWSASGYVGAFGRAMNRIYQIDEGRPVLKLRPSVAADAGRHRAGRLVLIGARGLRAAGRSPWATSSAWGDGAVTVWKIAKWPVMLAIVVVLVAMLYYATPNVRQPRFRWISVGAAIAILVWILASVGFGFYVANFALLQQDLRLPRGRDRLPAVAVADQPRTAVRGRADAEIERARQFQAGIAAEDSLQLPPRDTRASDKRAQKLEGQVAQGRGRLREGGGARRSREPGRPGAVSHGIPFLGSVARRAIGAGMPSGPGLDLVGHRRLWHTGPVA